MVAEKGERVVIRTGGRYKEYQNKNIVSKKMSWTHDILRTEKHQITKDLLLG